jgi:hypothetical protein
MDRGPKTQLKPTVVPFVVRELGEYKGQIMDADAAFDLALRDANLKLPIKHATKELKAKLEEDLGTALRVAIERLWGREMESPEEVAGRLTIMRLEGDDGDTYFLDETPLLWAGPITLEMEGDEMRSQRGVRILVTTKLQ